MMRWLIGPWLALALVTPTAAQDLTEFVEVEPGVLLATDVYLPAGGGPWPVVLERTPYPRRRDDLVAACESFRSHHLACAVQEDRGLNDSGGEFVFGATRCW